MNIFLLAFLSWVAWSMLKRARRKKAQSKLVPFREVVVTQRDSSGDRKGGKVLLVGGLGRAGKAVVEKLGEDCTLEMSVLDLYIPEAGEREPSVASYVQCDPTSAEDTYIALRGVETVYVMSTLSLPGEDKRTAPPTIPISDTMMSNIIDGCCSCGVKQLVVVTEMTHTLSKLVAEHKTSSIVKVTEQSEGGGSTAQEQMVIEASGDNLRTCIVRAGLLYCCHGDGRVEVEDEAQVSGKSYPTKTVPMVTAEHLAEVVVASAAVLSGGTHQGQVFLASEMTSEEQGLALQEQTSDSGPAVVVDNSETKKLLKI